MLLATKTTAAYSFYRKKNTNYNFDIVAYVQIYVVFFYDINALM